ncbi:hypothetical protein BH09PSE5_BH09PSE5_35950 [soil metagenome]
MSTYVRCSTQVTVTLRSAPAVVGTPGSATTADAHPQAPDESLPSGVVLYIEDNPVNLLLVHQWLVRWPKVLLLADRVNQVSRAAIELHLPLLDKCRVGGRTVLNRTSLRSGNGHHDLTVIIYDNISH